jgi:hypothetical protein
MNLKNQPTVFMPEDQMSDFEQSGNMSKAAWMDVAFDYATQICGADVTTTEGVAAVMKELQSRAELIRLQQKEGALDALSPAVSPASSYIRPLRSWSLRKSSGNILR